ncbi:MORN repeat variant [Chryseobacterium oranimense]|uniref:MORN repeat variant n=1 Tax=Chryseobacterium oranimense TaxID=421058 RepID=A0A1M5T867_9FLAO|nr:hypothetical protein [Chryseobacterium oranimense]SHH46543.1 MORN repeat variant [Chryseobacterium oranimense]
MKKILTSVLFALVIYITGDAQEKIYFDKNWEKTTPDKMEFYRVIEPKGKLTLIKDYYKNGTLQMEGLASDSTLGNEVFEGKVTWYTPEGKVATFIEYPKVHPAGPSQSFDKKGRLINDFVYSTNGDYRGKSYEYKDPQNKLYYNTIITYETPSVYKKVVYDEDIKGIRYEISVDQEGNSKTEYYGDKGKYIGTNNDFAKEYETTDSIQVGYYSNPMRVFQILKYKSDGSIKEGTIFRENGKIMQEEKRNKNDGYKITYDESGKKIGTLIYQTDKNSHLLKPQDGEDYEYNMDYTHISTIDVYKNGSVILCKSFDENGKLATEKTLKDKVVQEIKFYNPNESLKSILTYKDDMPYNGILYDNYSELTYADGVVVYSKFFSDSGKLKSEKKLNTKQNTYECFVYDKKGNLIYTYTQPREETLDFTAEIVQYINGKPTNTSSVKDGILISGKIRLQDVSEARELERSGKWILLKLYNDKGKLVQDSKILAEDITPDPHDFTSTTIREKALLDDSL